MKVKTFLMRIRTFFTRKRTIWTAVIVAVLFIGWFIFGGKSGNGSIQTDIVKKQDIQKTVLTTGQVVSSTDLSLSFQSGGVVRQLKVKEGDKVYQGQVLAVLDQGSSLAVLESARGALAQAEANYNKIKAAATEQDIAVSQAAVDSAETTLENAKQNLINQLQNSYTTTNVAVLNYTNILFSNPQTNSPIFSITGTVQTNPQLVSNVNSGRVMVNNALVSWQSKVPAINDSNVVDDIDSLVSDSLKYSNIVSNYFADIITLLSSYTQVTYGGSQTTITTYQSGVAAPRVLLTVNQLQY